MISPTKKKKKRRPARLVISDDENIESRSRSRSDSVSSEVSNKGKFMSTVPSSTNTSPDFPTVLLASDNSSSTTSTTSTYNTPSAVPLQSLADTFIDTNLASRLDYILPSPTKYTSLYPTTLVIPGPDNPTQPSPPNNNNTIRSPTYPTNITISTIVPTLHCSNTATTTNFTTVNTTASTSLVHSTPITSPIPSVTSVLISSPKLAPLFPEHPFQRPITPNKPRPKMTRQTTTDSDTDTDQMDYASAYVLAKNKRTRSPTSPTSTNPPKRPVKKQPEKIIDKPI